MKNLTTILLIFAATALHAQSVFEVSLSDVKTGENILLKNHSSPKGTVVVFFSAKCPYAKYYEDRLASIINEYAAQGISFVIANANISEDKDIMVSQADKFDAPYLLDSDKTLANLLEAKKSPEVFVLDKAGIVYYDGAIDDNPQVSDDVKFHYLKEALTGLINGSSPTLKESKPVGCMIR